MDDESKNLETDSDSNRRHDSGVRDDFDAIKDSERLSDWQWFVDRHPEHHLTEMVSAWVSEHGSPKTQANRFFTAATKLIGLLVGAATIFGVWIAFQQYQSTRPDTEEALNSANNIELAQDESLNLPMTALVDPQNDPTYLADWGKFFDAQKFRYFNPKEVLYLGASNSDPTNGCYGLNNLPPRELWPNIIPTIRALELLRDEIGAPARLISIYRSPEFNACLGGASGSTHLQFSAADFVVSGSETSPDEWATILRDRRSDGNFSGGIGVYNTFVHLDTRGTNADWAR